MLESGRLAQELLEGSGYQEMQMLPTSAPSAPQAEPAEEFVVVDNQSN